MEAEILNLFLAERAGQLGIAMDLSKKEIKDLSYCLNFEFGGIYTDEEIRTIRMKENSEGKISAESFKWFNISEVNVLQVIKFGLKISGATLLATEVSPEWFTAFLLVIIDFMPKLKHSFNPQDSLVLAGIAVITQGEKEKRFTTLEVKEQLKLTLKKSLSIAQIEDSMESLIDFLVIERKAQEAYILRETIHNLNRHS